MMKNIAMVVLVFLITIAVATAVSAFGTGWFGSMMGSHGMMGMGPAMMGGYGGGGYGHQDYYADDQVKNELKRTIQQLRQQYLDALKDPGTPADRIDRLEKQLEELSAIYTTPSGAAAPGGPARGSMPCWH